MEASGVATMPCTRPAWARWTCEEPAARSQILAVPSMDPGYAPEQGSASGEYLSTHNKASCSSNH